MKDNFKKGKFQSKTSIAKIVFYVFVFNIVAIGVFAFYKFDIASFDLDRGLQLSSKVNQKDSSFLGSDASDGSYQSSYDFMDKKLALKIITAFDIFEPVEEKYHGYRDPENSYSEPYLGLKSDPNYCNINRAFFVEHPDNVFEQKNFMIEVPPRAFLRKQAAAVGNDVMLHIGTHLAKAKKQDFLYDIDPSVTQYFTVRAMDHYKHVGLHFACLAQEYNHIPGHWSLNRKDTIAEKAIEYSKKFKEKPHCFNFERYFPETWLLHDTEACQDLFNRMARPEHKKMMKERKIVYIKKVAVGAHRGSGVTPLYEDEEKALMKEYRNGELCGLVTKSIIVQKYINNPLLVEKRKFDFRMYMTIASTDPLMVYYHDGYLRVSLYEYDENSKDKKVLLTNLALNNQLYKDIKEKGDFHGFESEEEIQMNQQWSFDMLQSYLFYTKKVDDPKWLDNYLRPEFKRAFGHLVRMASDTFLKRPQIYEFYGVDFMLDDDLTLWFIEANSGPAFGGKYNKQVMAVVSKMLRDHFDLMHRILRSRMKRVVAFVNKITASGQARINKEGKVEIKDFDKWRDEWERISKNKMEPEFELPASNGWSKVLDFNYEGTKRFAGLFNESCVDIE